MSRNEIKMVAEKNLETSMTSQYVSVGAKTTITKTEALNTTNAVITVTAHIVPPSGTAQASNMATKDKPIFPGESYPFYELIGRVMNPGDSLHVGASATGVTFGASGYVST